MTLPNVAKSHCPPSHSCLDGQMIVRSSRDAEALPSHVFPQDASIAISVIRTSYVLRASILAHRPLDRLARPE